MPRSPQGHPVIIQAGASDRGKRFSERWAETVFVGYPDLEDGKRRYAAFKQGVAQLGRDPDLVTVNTIAYPVVAATKAEAEDKMALIDTLYREVDGLSLLSEALNFDFSKKDMDEAFTDEELDGMSGMQAMRDRVMRVIGRNPTVRDFLEVTRRGRPREAIVGGPKEVADRFEQWFVERACDGYVVGGTHVPGTFEDFVQIRGAGVAAAGDFPDGLQGRDAAGESRAAMAADGLVEGGGRVDSTQTVLAELDPAANKTGSAADGRVKPGYDGRTDAGSTPVMAENNNRRVLTPARRSQRCPGRRRCTS